MSDINKHPRDKKSRGKKQIIAKKTKGKKHSDETYSRHVSSEDDDDDWVTDDDECSDEDKFDSKDYQKLLLKMFPSKYMNDIVGDAKGGKAAKGSKASKGGKASKGNSKSTHKTTSKDSVVKHKRKNKSHSRKESEHETDDESSAGSQSEDDSCYDSDSDYQDDTMHGKNSKVNIIFTIGAPGYDDSDDSDYSGGDSDDIYDNSDNSEYDDEFCEEDEEDCFTIKTRSKSKKKATHVCEHDCGYEGSYNECVKHEGKCPERSNSCDKKNVTESESESESASDTDAITDEDAIKKFQAMVETLSPKEKKNKFVKQMINDFEARNEKYRVSKKKNDKREKLAHTKKFKKLIRDKNVMNDTKYFKDKMTKEQQIVVLDQIKAIKVLCEVDKPYRLALLDSDIPVSYKACAYRKINTLKYMEPGGGEYYKIKNWVDTFMQIPFGKHKTLPLTIEDGVEKCHEFMENAKKTLDCAVYGLDDAKEQIMQMVGTWIANPSAIGTAIAIKGPMGTGKTTLVKEGISKILGRDFAFIALGGATDSSFLEGHSYTYEGSTWGKIVDIIIKCKSMNPVFYFDELDKVSDTAKGEEIIGILTHLTDSTQNSKFHDKYFAELEFDLSRCLFIFSYNDESKINPILRDRMYRIQTKGYDKKQKTVIATDYLLPKIQELVRFGSGDIIIPEDTVHHLIENYTDGEDGVRNLKRCLEIIYTKLNLYRLMKPGTNLFDKDSTLKVEFPMTVTVEIIEKLLKKTKEGGPWQHMYM
jgi:ATP-dependent Lon protease